MRELRCVDGSLLDVTAIPCRDRTGEPYDFTLELVRDGVRFATVGQRCGHQLAALAAQALVARQDREQAASWPDPDDRFPIPAGVPAQPGLVSFQPGELEYFTLRSRDRGDLPGTGEVRCALRCCAQWLEGAPGGWQLSRRAGFEAWGAGGTGVRAVLTSAELVMFLDNVLREPDGAAMASSSPAAAALAGEQSGRHIWPTWWQRGKVPDGCARSRLPALRAAARDVAVAVGGAPARRGDVRR